MSAILMAAFIWIIVLLCVAAILAAPFAVRSMKDDRSSPARESKPKTAAEVGAPPGGRSMLASFYPIIYVALVLVSLYVLYAGIATLIRVAPVALQSAGSARWLAAAAVGAVAFGILCPVALEVYRRRLGLAFSGEKKGKHAHGRSSD